MLTEEEWQNRLRFVNGYEGCREWLLYMESGMGRSDAAKTSMVVRLAVAIGLGLIWAIWLHLVSIQLFETIAGFLAVSVTGFLVYTGKCVPGITGSFVCGAFLSWSSSVLFANGYGIATPAIFYQGTVPCVLMFLGLSSFMCWLVPAQYVVYYWILSTSLKKYPRFGWVTLASIWLGHYALILAFFPFLFSQGQHSSSLSAVCNSLGLLLWLSITVFVVLHIVAIIYTAVGAQRFRVNEMIDELPLSRPSESEQPK